MDEKNGFTLIELLVALAVLAVLLVIGVPSYQNLTASNAGTTETNRILTSLQLARSEAITRGTSVRVCGANASRSACRSAETNWNNGWLVIPAGPGASVIRDYSTDETPNNFSINSVSRAVAFDRMGRLIGDSNAVVSVGLDCPNAKTRSGSVAIAPTGHTQATAPTCY